VQREESEGINEIRPYGQNSQLSSDNTKKRIVENGQTKNHRKIDHTSTLRGPLVIQIRIRVGNRMWTQGLHARREGVNVVTIGLLGLKA